MRLPFGRKGRPGGHAAGRKRPAAASTPESAPGSGPRALPPGSGDSDTPEAPGMREPTGPPALPGPPDQTAVPGPYGSGEPYGRAEPAGPARLPYGTPAPYGPAEPPYGPGSPADAPDPSDGDSETDGDRSPLLPGLARISERLRVPDTLRDLPFGWLVANRFALVGLVVVALAALFGAAHFSTPHGAEAAVARVRPVRAAVVSALAVCPGAEMGDGSSTRFGLVSPAGGTGAGSARVTRSGGSGGQAGALRRVGTGWFGDVTKPAAPLDVTGSGPLAAGLTGGQISAGKDDNDELSGTHCTRPATDSWYVGPGPADGDLKLHLANPDDGPATVSIDVYSDAGELDTSEAGAIFVPPHGTEDVSLADRASTAQLAALHVRTSMGRVAAALQATGKDHDGADWVPAGSAPAKRLTVPGVPGGSGGRELLVAAPGAQDATVRVSAVTADGTVVPGGEGPITVPAGAVVPVSLDGRLSGKAAALTLTSDRPVVAGLRADSTISGGRDVAYTAAEPPLDGRGVAAVNRADNDYKSSLVLSAVGGDLTVRVETTGPSGSNSPQTVRIKSGTTSEVTPAAPKDASSGYGIVVTGRSGSGRLYAARVLTRDVDGGELMTVDPLESAAGTVPVYPANDSEDAVVR